MKPLSDAQVKLFCRQNFIVLQPGALPRSFHERLFDKLESINANEGGIPGNDGLVAAVPELQQVFDDPVIRGGIESLVGPGTMMQYHRHCHRREATPGGDGGGQSWHKDDYYYEAPVRHKAAFRWIFALYYPQDTPLELGPTAILPGHAPHCVLSSCDPSLATEGEKPFTCPAGSVALVHFDSWHRAMPIHEGVRHMLKFHFVRMVEPSVTGPTWDPAAAEDVEEEWRRSEASNATYEWLCGRDCHKGPSASATSGAEQAVAAIWRGSEAERVAAALSAGAAAAAGDLAIVPRLIDCLRSDGVGEAAQIFEAGGVFGTQEAEGAPRRAKACNPAGTNPADLDVTHALAAAGSAAVPALLDALAEGAEEPWAVSCAAATLLGNANALASEDGILAACEALARCAETPNGHRWVRRNAVEALGTAAQGLYDAATRARVAQALVTALRHDAAPPDPEPEDAAERDQYDTEATVRVAAVLSVARLAGQWQAQGRRSGMDEFAVATPLLVAMAEGRDADAKHRLGGTMGDYAKYAVRHLENWVV